MSDPIATVESPGVGISFQDGGRLGWRRFGVAPAGVMDRYAAQTANQLLDNSETATLLEIAVGGARLKFLKSTWIAFAGGGSSPEIRNNSAMPIAAGSTLRINPSPTGIWSYLAIQGGWDAKEVFGSSSFHARSNLGTAIQSGDTIFASPPRTDPYPGVARRTVTGQLSVSTGTPTIRLHRGPHFDTFPQAAHQALTETEWEISPQSDRTGYRLVGDFLPLAPTIHSTPVLVGSVQIPPSGAPIVTLNDGPTVGGYPVIAVVDPDDLPALVQRAPHQPINFIWHE